MPNIRTIKNIFSAGEVSQEIYGQLDLVDYVKGVELARNVFVLPHGPVINRPGFRFVDYANNETSRLIPFVFSETQSFIIEICPGKFKFYFEGQTLKATNVNDWLSTTSYLKGMLARHPSTGRFYYAKQDSINQSLSDIDYWYILPEDGSLEVPNDPNIFSPDKIFKIRSKQSNDIVLFTNPDIPPIELKRYSNLRWVVDNLSFVPSIEPPVAINVNTTGSGSIVYNYVITALTPDGLEESFISNVVTALNDLTVSGNQNRPYWNAVEGAGRYNVYKESNGVYGYIGQTGGLTLSDNNIIADLSRTPPVFTETPFDSINNYPTAAGSFEQRRFYAGTYNNPTNVWATTSGSDYNMAFSIPSLPTDSMRFKVVSDKANRILHIVELNEILMFTASGEFRVFSSSGPISPQTLTIRAQGQSGATGVAPIVINNVAIYEQAKGGRVREISYNWQNQGYQSNDISMLCPHLFNGKSLVQIQFSRAPDPTIWALNDKNELLSCTYMPEHEVLGWTKHNTMGEFESISVIPEGNQDVLYAVIKRNLGGNDVRCIERLSERSITPKGMFFVDCGLSKKFLSEVSSISGLDHLNGETVTVVADGSVENSKLVVDGKITLDSPSKNVVVGLPYKSVVKTLPAVFNDITYGQSFRKNINKIWMRVKDSSALMVGPSEGKLVEMKFRNQEPLGDPAVLRSEEIDLMVYGDWNSTGQLVVEQPKPLPMMITYVIKEIAIGG